MAIKKNKYSVSKVLNQKGNVIGYLSTRDEENGLDIRLDSQGYKIVALWQRKKGENIMEKEKLYELEFIDRMHDLENFWIAPLS